MKVDPIGSPIALPAPPGAEEAKAQPYLVTVDNPQGVKQLWTLEVSLVYAGPADGEEDAKNKVAEFAEKLRKALPQMPSPGAM